MRTSGYGLRGMGFVVLAGGVGWQSGAMGDIRDVRVIRTLDTEARAVSFDQRVLDTPEPIVSDDLGVFDHAHDARAITDDERALAEVLSEQETLAETNLVRGRLASGAAARTRGVETDARGAGRSELNFRFTLTERARFSLVGDLIARDREGHFVDNSSIALVPLGDSDREAIIIDDPGHVEMFSDLPPGEYRFEVQAGVVAEAGGEEFSSIVGVIEFEFRLSECLADINADGELDAEDFFLFLDLFARDDPSVDFVRDGRIDSRDFFAYLDLFVLGCGD